MPFNAGHTDGSMQRPGNHSPVFSSSLISQWIRKVRAARRAMMPATIPISLHSGKAGVDNDAYADEFKYKDCGIGHQGQESF